MARKYLAFDIEIAKILPEQVGDLMAHRPLGITCAALHAEDEDQPHLWYSCFPTGTPAPQMKAADLVDLVLYLKEQVAGGYTIVTWNGVGFDFRVLGEESGLVSECSELAANHVDMMYFVHCMKGFSVSLASAVAAIGSQGKFQGISGVDAPRLWASGRTADVLAYVSNDCLITLNVAKISEEQGQFKWVTRRQTISAFDLPRGTMADSSRCISASRARHVLDGRTLAPDEIHLLAREGRIETYKLCFERNCVRHE